jgi:hypothetical protein
VPRTLLPSIGVALATMLVACVNPHARRPVLDLERESQRVLAAEDAYVAAEVRRDELALRKLVDEKFANNAANGTTTGKEDLIRNVLRMNMTGQTVSERSVILEGNVAIVMGTAELRFGGEGQPVRTSNLRYTSVFVKREGDWRMLALQMQPRATR